MMPRGLLGWSVPVLAAAAVAWLCWPRRPPPEPPEGPQGPPWFADVTRQVNLRFVHDAGPVGSYFMPQALGSGAALFDADGDGRLDVYLLHNGGPRGARNQLFLQRPGGTFAD